MKKTALFVLAASATLFATSLTPLPALRAQSLAPAPSLRAQLTASPTASQPPASLADRRKALNEPFHDYWEDLLKHDPEGVSAASALPS